MRKFLAGVSLYWLGFIPHVVPLVLQGDDFQIHKITAIPSDSQEGSESSQEAEIADPSSSTAPGHPIPLPQIADRAQELNHLLREITSQLQPKAALLQANEQAEVRTVEIRRRSLQAKDLLADSPTLMELEDELRYWRLLTNEYRARRKTLAALAARLQEQVQLLTTQEPEWEATWNRIHAQSGIDAVVEQVRKGRDTVRATRLQLDEQLKLVLILQNQISQQDQQISDVLVLVSQQRERELNQLLEPDGPPLWRASDQPQPEHADNTTFHWSWDRSVTSAKDFLRAHKAKGFSLIGLYLLTLFGTLKLQRYAHTQPWLNIRASALESIQRPFSLALLLILLLTLRYAGSVPIAVTFVFHLLYVIPVLRLLIPMIESELRSSLYVVTIFYCVMGFYLLVQFPPPLQRELHAVIVVSAIASFTWIGGLFRTAPRMRGRTSLILRISVRVCLLLLLASLTANIIGYVALSQLLSLPALIGPFLAAALYCAGRVLARLMKTTLHLPWLRNVPEIPTTAMEHWIDRALGLGVSFLWLTAMLHLLTIYDRVKTGVAEFLEQRLGFGKIHFTLAGALMVVVIVLAGYVLANGFTFLLQTFVLARWRLKRGLPFAISKVTYYFCLVLVGLAALSAAGVELNKFTVLTGALGVGLGFGMQNVVNNFVSGLILIFERPIHVGDIVDVGGLEGTVRRIGARSSTVVTFQGAEVIVPNSNLLSNQLINWTLSSPWRRIDIPIRVAYGTNPEQLTKLLVSLAESHPGVLLQRPPVAFFRGFGECALNFELRFWSAQQDTWLQLQSDVTVAIAKALREAGIEIPFPQRDLHIRTVSVADNRLVKEHFSDTPATATRDRG